MKVVQIVMALCLMVQLAVSNTISKDNVVSELCDSVCPYPFEKLDQFQYPGDCGKFCSCESDGNKAVSCREGLYFNGKLKVCDWPWNSDCDPSTTVTPPVSTSTGPEVCDTVCPSPFEEQRYFPYPGDCVKFCACKEEGNTVQSCPDYLYFNDKTQACDWPPNTDCDPSTSKPPPSSSSPVPPEVCDTVCPYPVEVPSYFPYPGDCAKYCYCTRNGSEVLTCRKGWYFDNKLKVCDWPWNSDCDPSTTVTPPSATTPTPSTEPEVCDTVCPSPIEIPNYFPYPGDCGKYCYCTRSGNEVLTCRKGWHFNDKLKVCDWPWNSDCDPSTTPTLTPTPPLDTSTAPSTGTEVCDVVCPNPFVLHHYFAYPGDCVKFCSCEEEGNTVRSCPDYLYFNDDRKFCDWPIYSGCDPSTTVAFP